MIPELRLINWNLVLMFWLLGFIHPKSGACSSDRDCHSWATLPASWCHQVFSSTAHANFVTLQELWDIRYDDGAQWGARLVTLRHDGKNSTGHILCALLVLSVAMICDIFCDLLWGYCLSLIQGRGYFNLQCLVSWIHSVAMAGHHLPQVVQYGPPHCEPNTFWDTSCLR